MTKNLLAAACALVLLAACEPTAQETPPPAADAPADAAVTSPDIGEPAEPGPSAALAADDADASGLPYQVTEVATFEEPWAMTFLPDGRALVTEKAGELRLIDVESGQIGTVSGVPEVAYGGQGGLGDVILHPGYDENGIVYISYAEPGDGDTRGGAVARARLALDEEGGGSLEDLEVIWRQVPFYEGRGHYSHRLLFDDEGYLFVTSGDRQEFTPAQDMASNLGKNLRLHDDGSVPEDNPFVDQGEIAAQVWTLGNRNTLGIAFDAEGRLWSHEMGPAGGDELNLLERGANYGYPVVSEGDHYSGEEIPNHDTHPEFVPPVVTWTPVISPAGFIIYSGDLFPDWQGSGFIGGLTSRGLVRVAFDGTEAREAERLDLGQRIREVEQGPDGAIWVLEDGREPTGSRLLRIAPAD